MERRLLVAIALSILVIVLFQAIFPKPRATSPTVSPMVQEKPAPSRQEALPEGSAASLPAAETAFEGEETTVITDRHVLTFSNVGGSLKDVRLKEYASRDADEPLHLVSSAGNENALLSVESNVLARALDAQKFTLTARDKGRIVYEYSIPDRFRIVKEYRLPNLSDYIELRLSIQNLGSDTIYKDYDILGASGIKTTTQVMGRRFLEINSMIDGKLVRNTSIKNGELFIRGIVSWTGVKERYFSVILRPMQESEGVVLKQLGKANLASGVRAKRTPIYAGSRADDSYVLYMGPNDVVRLKQLGFGLEEIINYGVFNAITKVLLTILRTFHKVSKNWGVAIIMLTFLMNAVLFPLTRKSFLSMRKIQEVQPHIEKLRKVHKDNPQKLNKELAEVYRQYNINPFGGCLPLLLQMPIFFALYQGLMRSIELKGASFLWIKDLSSPDSVNIGINLPLLGKELHILPILMAAAMFFQQKISTQHTAATSPEQQQQQKMMLIMFPLLFGFMFYNFPSGLVLYWLTNTVLMTIEHSSMRRSLTGR